VERAGAGRMSDVAAGSTVPGPDPAADTQPPWGRYGRSATLGTVAALSQLLLRVANSFEARRAPRGRLPWSSSGVPACPCEVL
jgi:hypothetical protein